MSIKYGKSEQVIYRERQSIVPCLFYLLLLIIIYMINDSLTYLLNFMLIITAYSILSFLIDNTIFTNERLIIRQQLIRKNSICYADILQMIMLHNKYLKSFDYGTIKIITATKTYNIKTGRLSKTYDNIADMITTKEDKEGDIDKLNGLVAKKPKFMRWRGSIDSLLYANNNDVNVIYAANWNTEAKNNVTKSICALANDYTMGGGFIIIGIEKGELGPILPPISLNDIKLGQIEKEILKASKSLFPPYPYEINFIRTNYQGRYILIFSIYWSYVNPHHALANIEEPKGSCPKYVINYGDSIGLQTTDSIGEADKQVINEQEVAGSSININRKPIVVEEGVTEISFYNNVDYWVIGPKGNEKHLKDSLGLLNIHTLLRYPNEPISSDVLYNEGKLINSDIIAPLSKVRDDIQLKSSNDGKSSLAIFERPSIQYKHDAQGKIHIQNAIDDLENELANFDPTIFENPEEALIRKEEIKAEILNYKKELKS